MSHLHIPDGVLPAWLLLLSWGLLCLALFPALRGRRQRDTILLGITVPFVVAAMSVPLPVHLNLLVLIGILAGPAVGFLTAVFSVSVLALFGHGGLSAIALNGLTLGVEPVLGWQLFRILRQLLSERSEQTCVHVSAFLAAGGALFCSLSLSLVILLLITQFGAFGAAETQGFIRPQLLAVFAPAALIAWALESFITALSVLYIHRVRPHLVPGWSGRRPA